MLVCGDIHGDWGKLNELISSKRPEIVLQVGDFGWWPNEKHIGTETTGGRKKKWNPRGIKSNGTMVYFCDGNHEDHHSLKQNGHAQELYENVWHCSRGTCLTLPDGKKVLFAGGAHSIDKERRIPGVDWFQEELITNSDFNKMVAHSKIDIIISHTCPTVFPIDGNLGKIRDCCRFALTEVLHYYNPELWFFGHWHKHVTGKFKNTRFEGLDYPGHGGRWWRWI